MKPIVIGLDANGENIYLTPEMRENTHMHILGGSGKGKSKFLEWMIRQDIAAGHGLCVIDWHGELYNNLLRWCSWHDVGLFNDYRKLILMNLAHPVWVTSFNPFIRSDDSISAQVSRLIAVILRVWGGTKSDEMPTFERTCTALLTFMLETGETLPNAAKLLSFSNTDLREFAIRAVSDPAVSSIWRDMQNINRMETWDGRVLSTQNRLMRFNATSAKRFMGLNVPGLDVAKAMKEGAVILVNLADSADLPREAAKLFAATFLRKFFDAAMNQAETLSRAGEKPSRYSLYLDEFQEYINDDMAGMLDQVRKGGLHMILTHQRLAHFLDYPSLQEAVLINARIRAVFGGLTTKSSCELAEEMCLAELNERQVKKALYHTIHLYQEEKRTIYSSSEMESETDAEGESSGSGSGYGSSIGEGTGLSDMHAYMMPPGTGAEGSESWYETQSAGSSGFTSSMSSETHSDFSGSSSMHGSSKGSAHGRSVVPVWVPIPTQELAQEQDWTLEEKRLKLAQMLKHQAERHCYLKLDEMATQPLCVPYVEMPKVSEKSLDEYEEMVCKKQGGLPIEEVDKLLLESEEHFIDRLREAPNPKKIAGATAKDFDDEFFE